MSVIIDTTGWSYKGVPRPRPDPPPYTQRGWIATIPSKALLHPALPTVDNTGAARCPTCGRDVRDYEITILGQRHPRPDVCAGCHQAITWAGWADHREAAITRLKAAGTFVEDEDEEPENEPCTCCGDWCDPEEEGGLCPACADQGCMGRRPPKNRTRNPTSAPAAGLPVTPTNTAGSVGSAGTADATPRNN